MIGDEGALDPHQNETRTAWSVSFRRAAMWALSVGPRQKAWK
jgi:hypothetical protein